MIILKILIIFLILVIVFCIYMMLKNENTFRVHKLLLNAIYLQNIEKINVGKFEKKISFDVIENYDKTFWRLWDWSYKRCVSPDVLQELKPYLYKKEDV